MASGGQHNEARESRIADLRMAIGLNPHSAQINEAWQEIFALRAEQLEEQREQMQ